MLDLAEAQKLIEDLVISKRDNCAIMSERTIEYDFGWAFFYQAIAYIESRDFRDLLVGHGPVIVDKNTGKFFETGCAYPTDYYVNAYRACGDALAELTPFIEMSGFKEGAQKEAAIRYIKQTSKLDLRRSKAIVDKALKNEVSSFSASSLAQAAELVQILDSYNFVCKQLWSNQL